MRDRYRPGLLDPIARYGSQHRGVPRDQYITDLLDVDEKSCDSYLRYMNEAATYNFVTSRKQGPGYGGGVHKEYAFVDDPSVVSKTLREDFRLEQAGHDEDLIRSVVNAQIEEFCDT